ncbi:hypothetical protein EIP91_003342 [Steccherinum ochraceum]|uniref:Uncharacterized protein n=1 Tax=Steccherinum ochraceum TaxID=92696 RepID=A0A4R0RAS0_9APHY|nr:hypothetical protein EIP91_003342 [Steccherinum ochraceum]
MPSKPTASRATGGAAKQTTPSDASRIQSSQVCLPPPLAFAPPLLSAPHHPLPPSASPTPISNFTPQAKAGQSTGKGSFPARAQGAAAKNANASPAATPAAAGKTGKGGKVI